MKSNKMNQPWNGRFVHSSSQLLGLFILVIVNSCRFSVVHGQGGGGLSNFACSVCAGEEHMTHPDGIIPSNSLEWLQSNISCTDMDFMAQNATYSAIQCATIRLSTNPSIPEDLCGCTATTPPTTSTSGSGGEGEEEVSGTAVNEGGENTTTSPIPDDNKVNCMIHARLENVTTTMSSSMIGWYVQVMQSFLLNSTNTVDDPITSIAITLSEQQLLVNDANNTRTRQLLRKTGSGLTMTTKTVHYNNNNHNKNRNVQEMIIVEPKPGYPLDTTIDVTGLTTINSSRTDTSFRTEVIQIINNNEETILSLLKKGPTLAEITYYATVVSIIASDPDSPVPPPPPTPSSDNEALAPSPPPPAPTAAADDDDINGAAIAGICIAALVILTLVINAYTNKKRSDQNNALSVKPSSSSTSAGSNGGSTNTRSNNNKNLITRTIVAPPGPLGIVVDVPSDAGGPIVYKLNEGSPLEGLLYPGDIIIQINDINTRKMSATEIGTLFSRTSHNKERTIKVLGIKSPPLSASLLTTPSTTTPSDKIDGTAGATPSLDNTSVDNQTPVISNVQKSINNHNNHIPRTVIAPPGKLNIVIDTSLEGPVVHEVKSGSSLEGLIYPGDIIIGIDDVDTKAMSASAITALMARTANLERKIKILGSSPPATASVSTTDAATGSAGSTPTVDSTTYIATTNDTCDGTAAGTTTTPGVDVSLAEPTAASTTTATVITSETTASSSTTTTPEAPPAPPATSNNRQPKMILRTVIAPPGKLNIVIDTSLEGPVVHKVNPGSPCEGSLFPGDIIVAIDDVDTRAMSGSAITALMVRTANLRRRLTVLSEDISS